jgi:CBS-domain-containing membrane protein
MIGLADWAAMPLVAVPFTTSIVLVMAAPESAPAQPRAIAGGHILSTLSGFAILWLLGPSQWNAVIAVGLSIFLMHLTDTMHPPAGIDALLVVTMHPAWTFFFDPVLVGVMVLVLFAYCYHRLTQPRIWPNFRG